MGDCFDPPCRFCGEYIHPEDWYDKECEVCGVEVCKACVDKRGVILGRFLHSACDHDKEILNA